MAKIKEVMTKIDWRIAITAIVCITILEALAIIKEVDGVMFSAALIAIAGITGVKLQHWLRK